MQKRSTALVLVLFAIALGPTIAHGQTTAVYDDFSLARINPEKWMGSESTLGAGASSNEIFRGIVAVTGEAKMLLRATGATSSDSGSLFAGNRLRVGHPKLTAGTPIIQVIEAQVNVIDASVDACPGNTGVASRVRAQIAGAFFNDGTGTNQAGNRTGDVTAGVQKVIDSNFGNRVEAFINRCIDAGCATASLGSTGFTRSWVTNSPDVMRITWVPGENKFQFTVNGPEGDETVTLGYVVADAAKPKRIFHELIESFTLANCTAGAVEGFMDLRIDNVRLDQAAIDATN